MVVNIPFYLSYHLPFYLKNSHKGTKPPSFFNDQNTHPMQTSVVRIRPIRKNIRKSNWIISNLYGVNMNKNGLKPTPIVNEACSFKRFSSFFENMSEFYSWYILGGEGNSKHTDWSTAHMELSMVHLVFSVSFVLLLLLLLLLLLWLLLLLLCRQQSQKQCISISTWEQVGYHLHFSLLFTHTRHPCGTKP